MYMALYTLFLLSGDAVYAHLGSYPYMLGTSKPARFPLICCTMEGVAVIYIS